MEATAINERIGGTLAEKAVQSHSEKGGQARISETALPPELLQRISKGNEGAAKELVERMNRFMEANRYALKFIVDSEGGGIIIKVLDSNGNIVRRIPPEAASEILLKIGENIGLIVNRILE